MAAFTNASRVARRFAQAARLMIGVPDYDNYLAHMKSQHPDQPVMSREEFFRNRLNARYGGKGQVGRCC